MRKILGGILGSAILLASGFVWCSFGSIAAPLTPIYGDANEDREVNMGDVVFIERIILGLEEPTSGADANINGQVDMGDVVWVERQVLGLSPVYGDSNGDLKITLEDVVNVEQHILFSEIYDPRSDSNRDGKVSMADVVTIERMLLEE